MLQKNMIWELCLNGYPSQIRARFYDANFLLIVASLSAYDESWDSSCARDPEMNCMRENLGTFRMVLHNRWLRCMNVILFLNKVDVLAEKIQTSDLQTYFPEYTGKKGDAEAAMEFIRGLYLTVAEGAMRPVYVRITCAIDAEDIRQAFIDVKDNVLAKCIIK
ncbi:hypothetical protein GJAV_G00122700 [Gymnothorax javanicus]|nr:hypothetical protein GJAV_G00122700 [Gymnothorax javanicus]